MKTTRTSSDASKRMNEALKTIATAEVRVGWFESAKYATKAQTPAAYVAMINEFGAHARPFMRPTQDKQKAAWATLMGQLGKRIVTGQMSAEQAMQAMGELVKADIYKTMSEITEPPLSIITLMIRKMRKENQAVEINATIVGQLAAYVHEVGEGNVDVSGVSTKPLNDTGYLMDSIAYTVDIKK